LSVIQITSSGYRSILANDFEKPIEIGVQEPVKIVKVDMVTNSPKSISPQVAIVDNLVIIRPLLLNQDDSFTLAIISDQTKPDFNPKVRISGVSDVQVEDATKTKNSTYVTFLMVLVGWCLLVVFSMTSEPKLTHECIKLRERASNFIAFTSLVAGIFIITFAIINEVSLIWYIVFVFFLRVIAMIVASRLNKSAKEL
jgi:hypothetical protein